MNDLVLYGGVFLVMALFFFGCYWLLFGGKNPNWTFRIYVLLVVGLFLVGASVAAA
jgi:hypothetical protein